MGTSAPRVYPLRVLEADPLPDNPRSAALFPTTLELLPEADRQEGSDPGHVGDLLTLVALTD